ncbi:MAG: Glu-tRNA(Gln) amidotransferase GatDE subunit E [Marinilabiliales bacterium]|nr:MAG: Glu-tRNA(Gln) amidotransferase GatDE subunit E [Marinilabiliales bacterium]
MKKKFDPRSNYEATLKKVGYVPRSEATQETYDAIGFMSGLEVHQQLKTKKKLFCHCPAGVFHSHDEYDAEVIRHMRPTLSELGEYDGTALMEFKTRKEIIYRIKNETTCTYEVDDTPPFPIDREALEIALKISMLSKLNIVGEVHITRKQYLDGSIPTGFQRTAILGVEGEIPLKNKMVRLIQLSIEEDSCREISDIGHTRVYKTDRLGMPLIETVTYPDMVNPDEVKEAAQYIRFLNRSTGLVRTGMGAGREDVNVSCKGGTRVEVKGVAHNAWIPQITHVECFRQWALLQIRSALNQYCKKENWSMTHKKLNFYDYKFENEILQNAHGRKEKFFAVNLPGFQGLLSHFTQPGKVFANEIMDRLKVIACIEKPNMTFSEDLNPMVSEEDFDRIREMLGAEEKDAQILFWAPADDVKTALETIEERCLMAFEGVPQETRKYLDDCTTIFERVLPGADRMYPDTDSAPIPLEEKYIQELRKDLPTDIYDRYQQMKKWGIPEDTYTFIFRNNLFPLIEKVKKELKIEPKFTGTFLGHDLKYVEGHYAGKEPFNYCRVFSLFEFLKANKITLELAKEMMPVIYEHPQMDFESVLTSIKFKPMKSADLIGQIPFFKEKYSKEKRKDDKVCETNWIMGQMHRAALGNMELKTLRNEIEKL